MTIAFLDVCYRGAGARAACVVAESWQAQTLRSSHVQTVDTVEAYEPGSFYRRELPCLVSVLGLLPERPAIAVIDGYVWLPPAQRPGLGARLHESLGKETPVVGIAKTAFAGAEGCSFVVPVFRGRSVRALYVTAAGIETIEAAERVRTMAGKHRIPTLVRMADQLARWTSRLRR